MYILVYLVHIPCVGWSSCIQDCMATIPPYPYYIRECGNGYDVAAALFGPDCMWIVRPQLFFYCTLPGCGTLAGPSLAWAGSLWLKPMRYARCPGQRLPSEDGQLRGLACDLGLWWFKHHGYIHGIYTVYTLHIQSFSKTCFVCRIELLSCYAIVCTSI